MNKTLNIQINKKLQQTAKNTFGTRTHKFAYCFFIRIQISLTFRFSLIHIWINRSPQFFSHDTLVTAILLWHAPNLLWSDDQKLNYDKIKFYNIPHVTENSLWTGPRVIKTTKFEESRSIMERKICVNPLINHAYQWLIIDIINDNHIEYIRSEWPEVFELMWPHRSDPLFSFTWVSFEFGRNFRVGETVAVWPVGCSGWKPLLLKLQSLNKWPPRT